MNKKPIIHKSKYLFFLRKFSWQKITQFLQRITLWDCQIPFSERGEFFLSKGSLVRKLGGVRVIGNLKI